MTTYKISLAEAATYISNLLNELPLRPIAQNIALGGTFGLPSLPNQSNKGIMFWYNLERNASGNDKVFAVFQTYIDPLGNVGNVLPVGSNQLFQPDETFTYNGSTYDVATIENYISGHSTNNTPASSNITKQEVEDNIDTLVQYLPKDSNGIIYNNRVHLFFEADDSFGDFYDLLTQNSSVAGFRYYLGLDKSTPIPNNRIRLIMVAVDGNGANIINSANPIFMQRGHPK